MIDTALFVIIATITNKLLGSSMWNCWNEHCMKQVCYGGLILKIVHENED